MKAVWRALFLGGAAGWLAACSSGTTTVAVVPAMDIESTAAASDAAVSYAWVDPIPDTVFFARAATARFDPAVAASTAASSIDRYFTPAGCAQATASGAVVTATLNSCVGPIQFNSVSGTFTVTYSNGSTGPQVHIAATNLLVGGIAYDVALTGTVGRMGSTRTFAYTSTTQRTSDPSNSRTVTGTSSWMVGSECITVNETGMRTISGVMYTISLTNYEQCTGHCPTSGTLTMTGPSGSATTTFNGTPNPTVTDQKGDRTTATLLCQ